MTHIVAYIADALQEIYPPQEVQSLTLILCKDLLGLSDIDIYLRKDIKLSDTQQRLLEQTVERLKKHEPVQYVLGRADFYGLSFRVAPGVLIPRPETEELVDLILKENSGAVRVLDIGTGSGCIAISLAKHLPDGQVDAWDVSAEALAIARDNANRLNVAVNFAQVDVLCAEPQRNTYHVLASNPPYIAEKERAGMDKNVLNWEPDLALFVPDWDPLRFYRHIAQLGLEMLVPEGKLYVEINQAYGPETTALLHALNYKNIRLIDDLFGNNRIITATR